jgi:ribosomal peptide maturation radical SAM protein 1
MRIVLVNMPWATIDVPSLALGILTTRTRQAAGGAEVRTLHANLDFVDWAGEKLGLDGEEYSFFAEESYFAGCGDWVFSAALYGDRGWRVDEFDRVIAPAIPPERRALARRLHELAPDAIEHLVGKIFDERPDLVGFTSTFQQNTASLAAARRIKELAPEVTTVFGGANCEAEQGGALHRNFPFVDFVVRGEGEAAFPALLGALAGTGSLAGIPGLCYRTGDGAAVANPMAGRPLPPGQIASPDYTDYFNRFETSLARSWADAKLTVESSRGCWWGEKHHCTFCGLNGSFMQFRGKPAETFLAELTELVRRHRVLDVVVVDNILEMDYLHSLLPALAALGNDLRIHYEIKANLRRHQLQALHDAGVVLVQPGIESLSSRVLTIMDKGVTGCQNVRLLRDAESVGLAVSWNYLYGFPGETPADYTSILDQLPRLSHLTPPTACSRIGIERFSPYFERPELGFAPLRPAPQYGAIYDLPEPELMDLAYLFDAPHRGIDDPLADRLAAALSEWGAAHGSSRLTHCDLGDEYVLVNRRSGFDWTVELLHDPVEVAAFRLLEQPRTAATLARRVCEAVEAPVADHRVEELLARWRELGIVFEEAGQLIHIAPAATNRELTRLGQLALRSRG